MFAKLVRLGAVNADADLGCECLFEGTKVHWCPDPTGAVSFVMQDGNNVVTEWLLDANCKVYLMNESGKTIDTIYGTTPPQDGD
jgi:hypothetical protein